MISRYQIHICKKCTRNNVSNSASEIYENQHKSIIYKKRNVSSHFDKDSFPENHIINENQFQSQNPLKQIFVLYS